MLPTRFSSSRVYLWMGINPIVDSKGGTFMRQMSCEEQYIRTARDSAVNEMIARCSKSSDYQISCEYDVVVFALLHIHGEITM